MESISSSTNSTIGPQITSVGDLQQAILQGISVDVFEKALKALTMDQTFLKRNDTLNVMLLYCIAAQQEQVVNAELVQKKILDCAPRLYLSTMQDLLTRPEHSPLNAFEIVKYFLNNDAITPFTEEMIDYFLVELDVSMEQYNNQLMTSVFHQLYSSEVMKPYGLLLKKPNAESSLHNLIHSINNPNEWQDLQLDETEQVQFKEMAALYYSFKQVQIVDCFQFMDQLGCSMTPILVRRMLGNVKWESEIILKRIFQEIKENKVVNPNVLRETAFLFMTIQPNEPAWVHHFLNVEVSGTFVISKEMKNLFIHYWGEGPYEGFSLNQLANGNYQVQSLD